MFGGYYAGKRVLVTGHSGFKGGWLSLWLKRLGARVVGLGLDAPTHPSFYEAACGGVFEEEVSCDIRDAGALRSALEKAAPDFIFHLAAQPLVRESYDRPLATIETNVMGTAHLLEAVRELGMGSPMVLVTSDKCYRNRQWPYAYREEDALGGGDIYSMSKGAAELVIQSYRESFFYPESGLGGIASARAGNVIGGGDYAADRIVPDCVRALLKNEPVRVRHAEATRPWQHVLDCLSGYLWLGACLGGGREPSRFATSFNFGPGPGANRPVGELVEQVLRIWPGTWEGGEPDRVRREAMMLNLTIDKAVLLLGWQPSWGFEEAVRRTMEWYHAWHVGGEKEMRKFSIGQIDALCGSAARQQRVWSGAGVERGIRQEEGR